MKAGALSTLKANSAARVYKTVAGGDDETIILITPARSTGRAVTASCQVHSANLWAGIWRKVLINSGHRGGFAGANG